MTIWRVPQCVSNACGLERTPCSGQHPETQSLQGEFLWPRQKSASRKRSSAKRRAFAQSRKPSKAALINLIAEQNDVPRKTAVGVFATLESVLLGSVHPRGVGEIPLPGLLKVTLRKVPARRVGTLVRNPATGEMIKGAA
jgi:hypothetical protein